MGIFNSQVAGEEYTSKSPFEAKPRNRKEAQASNYWPQYFDAEVEEMTNHQENGTWILVPIASLPKGTKFYVPSGYMMIRRVWMGKLRASRRV